MLRSGSRESDPEDGAGGGNGSGYSRAPGATFGTNPEREGKVVVVMYVMPPPSPTSSS